MYRIIKLDGTELGMTDSVLYIKVTESGSFTPCSTVLFCVGWLVRCGNRV